MKEYYSIVVQGKVVDIYQSRIEAIAHIKIKQNQIAKYLGITKETASRYINTKNIKKVTISIKK